MMINEIPKISITQDYVTDDPDDEIDDNECTSNIKEAHTDVEDLDSDSGGVERVKKRESNTLKIRKKSKTPNDISDAGTDIEDLDDSQSESEINQQPDDIEISLTEFLDQGFVDETASFDGKDKLNQSRRNKRASLLGIAGNDDGAITDCEDLQTSDEADDIDIVDLDDPANRHYNNILMQCDDFNTVSVQGATIATKNKNRQQWRASTSRGLDIQHSDSDAEQPTSWNALSDVENMAVSDEDDVPQPFYSKMKHSKSALDAEEMVIAASDTEEPNADRQASCPAIDIGFRYAGDANRSNVLRHRKPNVAQKSSNALMVDAASDDILTDVENLDSSDDDDNNIRNKLAIPIAYVLSKSAPLTDVEDFDVDDDCFTSCSKDIKLPSPVREIKLITEDNQGDPVAKVMPLAASASGTFLGVTEPYIDKGLTDTEDMSGNEEEYCSGHMYETAELPSYDGGIVSSTDGITSFTRNRKFCGGDVEPVTDIEEMAIHGAGKQLRRKRSKPKSKCRPFLNVAEGRNEQALTDTEELYISDDQVGRFGAVRQNLATLQLGDGGNRDGGKTDTEDLSDDDGLLAKDTVTDIDPNIFRQDVFFSTIMSSECATAADRNKESYSKISTVIKTKEASQQSSELSLTDIEDINIQSDVDDNQLNVDYDTYSRAQTVTPMELRSAFNEGANFSVHDRANSSFDPTNEAIHIKGYRDIQDNNTDVEFLDEDTPKTCIVNLYLAFNCFSIYPFYFMVYFSALSVFQVGKKNTKPRIESMLRSIIILLAKIICYELME